MPKIDESDGYDGLMPTEKEVVNIFEKYGAIKAYNILNNLRDEIHKNALDHGFYDNIEVNIPEKLMLIVSELGEAMEAYRKAKYADLALYTQIINNNIFNRSADVLFEQAVKDTFEDELADTIIRILDLCGYMKINIDKHIELKIQYNKNRPYKHGKKC